MPATTKKPANCDECPFHERIEGTLLNCNFYNLGGPLTTKTKFPFCKVVSIDPTCPYCGSKNVREIPHKVGHMAVLSDDRPKDEEVPFYRCLACGREFDETEMEE